MNKFTESTFGTWGKGDDRLTIEYLDESRVKASNSKGERWTMTIREWLERYDAIRDDGWLRV